MYDVESDCRVSEITEIMKHKYENPDHPEIQWISEEDQEYRDEVMKSEWIEISLGFDEGMEDKSG